MTLTRKGERTRQRIVDAAAELIFRRGVAATTTEEVRSAAQVSNSQLYHYFAAKEDLVRAVIEHQTEAIVANQEKARLDSLQGLADWRDFVIEIELGLGCRGGCPLGSLGSELAEVDSRARRELAESFRRWETVIRRDLRSMHDRGELVAAADPDELALATLAALQGGLLLAQVERSVKPLEIALDAMISLITMLSVQRRVSGGQRPDESAAALDEHHQIYRSSTSPPSASAHPR